MDQSHRQKLLNNKTKLMEIINFDKLRPELEKRKIFSRSMLIDIDNAGPTDRDKNTRLLTFLPKRGPRAYNDFVRCLIDSNQLPPARILNDIIPDAGVWQGTVVPAMQLPSESEHDIYPMKSNPRGVALIISVINFENNNMPERDGGEIDEENLNRLFYYLEFTVVIHRNKTAEEIRMILRNFRIDERHRNADACIVVILSHGCEKGFCSYDANTISNKDVLQMFNNKNCPILHNKPKLFFFQHCRGDDYDHAVPFAGETMDFDSYNVVDLPSLPTLSDMMVCYSTSPQTVSLRSKESGTLFISIIVDVFSQHAHNMHLEDLLRKVANRMLPLEVDGWKQSPEYTAHGWRRKLYFNPGLV